MLLEVIAEKTGYPTEMLELDMALDADLGIDSIKRVEILSALQERLPEAPVIKPEHLGTLHNLRQIAAFLAAATRSVEDRAFPRQSGGTTKTTSRSSGAFCERSHWQIRPPGKRFDCKRVRKSGSRRTMPSCRRRSINVCVGWAIVRDVCRSPPSASWSARRRLAAW